MSDALACPRCGGRLFMSSTTAITIRACGACGGVFLDNAAASRLMSLVPEDALGLVEGVDAHAPRRVSNAPRIACPMCQRQMDRVHIKAADVEIDTCSAHGTFYDRKELVTVARACKRSRVAPKVAAAAAVAGVAGVAAASAMSGQQQQVQNTAADHVETAVDVVEAAVDVADVADVGGSLLEGAGDLFGGLFELLGGLADISG